MIITHVKEFITSISWQSIAHILQTILSFIFITKFTVEFGIDDYGRYAFILGFFGINFSLMNALRIKIKKNEVDFESLFIMIISTSIILGIFLTISEGFLVGIISCLYSTLSIFFINLINLENNGIHGKSAKIKLVANAVSILIKLSLVLIKFNWKLILLIQVIEIMPWIRGRPKTINFNWIKFSRFIRENWGVIVSTLMIWAYMRADSFILRIYGSDLQLGSYMTSLKLVESFYFVGIYLSYILISRITEVRLRRLYFKLSILVIIVVPILPVVIALILSKLWLEYQDILRPTLILAPMIPIIFVGVMYQNIQIEMGNNWILLVKSLVAFMLNIIISWMVFKIYGNITSIAVVTMLVQLLVSIVINLCHQSSRKTFNEYFINRV